MFLTKTLLQGTVRRQTRQARDLLPGNRRWCSYCNCSFEIEKQHLHQEGKRHISAVRKFHGMKKLAERLWVKHRGAPPHMEVAPAKEREIVQHAPRIVPPRIASGPTTRMRQSGGGGRGKFN